MNSITAAHNNENIEILRTVEVALEGIMQKAHLCSDQKIYTQNHNGQWVNDDTIQTVQKYGNFLPVQKALEEAQKKFDAS